MSTSPAPAQVSTRPASVLMWLTYVIGGIGAFIGFITVFDDPPSLTIAAVLAVGVTGILSFLRHGIYNRSDAVRGGWDYGTRNNFQVEVGLANLAWGVYAIVAVILDWGLMALSASFLISGAYFVFVTVFVIVTSDIGNRRIGPLLGIGSWGVFMVALGVLGVIAAG